MVRGKSNLEKLNDQLQRLYKKLIFAETQHISKKTQLQIIQLKKKIAIAEMNARSGFNNVNYREVQGGSPGLGKRK